MAPGLAGEVPLGALVEVTAGRGHVRFSGNTSFSTGKWIGIELLEANGKNDGSVQGVAYFTCKPSHGVFVKPSQVRVVDISPPVVSAPAPRAGHQRTGSRPINSLNRSQSIRSNDAGSSTRSASPAKIAPPPATRRLGPGPPSPTKASPPTRLLASPGPSSRTPRTPAGRLSSSLSTPPSARVSPALHSVETSHTPPPPSTPKVEPVAALEPDFREGSPAPLSPRPPPSPTASLLLSAHKPPPPPPPDESQELRIKLRVLEAKRADDARHVRELETRLQEAETFVALRPKLQAKLQSLQTDNVTLKRTLADNKIQLERLEGQIVESSEQLEMMMLDKEVAEERAETAESELEEEREKRLDAEIKLEVYDSNESGDKAEGEGPDPKSAVAIIQLEKQNERLKEALIRLRDITHETERDYRRKIADLERELGDVDDLQSEHAQTLARLENADLQIEDLKSQLDDALESEEMLVQLTERNLFMGEKIEEMRVTIEDLEALKELNDEIEEDHVETEKALQEDINRQETTVREQARTIEVLQEGLQDYESTIQQFRELVTNLQNELDNLREEHQVQQSEYQTTHAQSSAIMSLNMRLQSSALKSQVKNIDFEVRQLEAAQAKEMLVISQPYLPAAYSDADRDAANCYMFFQRVAFKADLINSVVAQNRNLPESLNGDVTDSLVGVCEMRGQIAHFSCLCKRFVAVLRRCDVESFLNIGKMYLDIAPLEKRIDMHIDLLRREEFRNMECVSDISKMVAQFEHLDETYFSGFDYDLGERELGLVTTVDHELDVFAAALGLTRTSIATITKDDDIVLEMGDLDIESQLFEPLQQLLDQTRSAKVLSRKLVKRVEELLQSTAALKVPVIPQLQALTNVVSKAVDFSIQLAQHVGLYLADVRAAKHPFELSSILSFVRQIAGATTNRSDLSSWAAMKELISALTRDAGALVPIASESQNVIKINGESPWVARVEEVRSNAAINLEAERTVTKLGEEMQELVRGIKTRDQNLQEAGVKIELMERRMETVKKQADTITDLEAEIAKARKQEHAYEEAMEQIQADLDNIEQENARLKLNVNSVERPAAGPQPAEGEATAVEGSFETSHLLEQIESFRGTVRFLRSENTYLKGQDLLRELHSLPDLPDISIPPPLDASTSSSDLSDDDDAYKPRAKQSLRSLSTETKLLYRDVITYSSSPRVVDLSVLNTGKTWVPQKKTPAHQLWERQQEGEKLQKRIKGLAERTESLTIKKLDHGAARRLRAA